MPNGLHGSRLRCVWRNVEPRFGRRERREGEATNDWQRIWESPRAARWEVTSQSWQYNFHGCDSSGAEQQQWPDIRQATPKLLLTCEALEWADWFHQKNCSPKEPYCLTAICKCTLTPAEYNEEYLGFYAPSQRMNDPVHGQISYNGCLSNAIKLQLGHNLQQFLAELKEATGKDIVENVIRLAKAIPASLITLKLRPTADQYIVA